VGNRTRGRLFLCHRAHGGRFCAVAALQRLMTLLGDLRVCLFVH
jgi:hypothetical protein